MAKLNLSDADLDELANGGNSHKVLSAMRHATEEHDFDSGWTAVPANLAFTHKMGALPRRVEVYGSNDPRGNGYAQLAATNVNNSNISVPTGYKFYRVLSDR